MTHLLTLAVCHLLALPIAVPCTPLATSVTQRASKIDKAYGFTVECNAGIYWFTSPLYSVHCPWLIWEYNTIENKGGKPHITLRMYGIKCSSIKCGVPGLKKFFYLSEQEERTMKVLMKFQILGRLLQWNHLHFFFLLVWKAGNKTLPQHILIMACFVESRGL